MIITRHGFDADRLTPELAALLGDGSGIMAEAALTNCELMEPVHFLAFLAKAGGSLLQREFLEPRRVRPEQFCELVYEMALDEDRAPGAPLEFGPQALSPAAQRMLAAFEEEIPRLNLERGTEALLLLVLLRHLDESVQRALAATAGSQEAFDKFRSLLERRTRTVERQPVFDERTGKVLETAFDPTGRRVLARLREETAALGYKKATTMHLLYALVGIEGGVLQRAIQYQAIDPVRDVHSYLSRELAHPGAKRVPDFELKRAALYDSVAHVLEEAAGDAGRDGARINELHIARALARAQSGVVTSFLVMRRIDLPILRDYLARAEAQVEEGGDSRRIPIDQIESELKSRILGQEQAIRRILPWIKRLRFNYTRERGPAAVLMFLGPSGTGKTQLAKELARTVYGSEDQLIMLEMGQFQSKESANIFIGAPPGYVGYGEGRLTNGLRDKPESVVLFDEIEKACEDVWVTLMRFLDEGLINDPAGPTRDGRRCIVVLTSNLGVEEFARQPALDEGSLEAERAMEELIRTVVIRYLKRPEIYNRVDDKVVFRPFGPATYRALIEQQVGVEVRKFATAHDAEITVTPDAVEWLAQQACEAAAEGARCVPRIVNRYVVAPVIDLLTQHEHAGTRRIAISDRGYGAPAVEEA